MNTKIILNVIRKSVKLKLLSSNLVLIKVLSKLMKNAFNASKLKNKIKNTTTKIGKMAIKTIILYKYAVFSIRFEIFVRKTNEMFNLLFLSVMYYNNQQMQ